MEAAGRIGGRVSTHPELSDEFPVELGAEFIHGPTNVLMDLVKKYKIEIEDIFTWAQGDGGPSDAAVRGCGGMCMRKPNSFGGVARVCAVAAVTVLCTVP